MRVVRTTLALLVIMFAMVMSSGHAKNRPGAELTYDNLLALDPAEQHGQCMAFLTILRTFVSPDENNPNDPSSIDARSEVHTMWMFIHYAADHPGVQPAEISEVLMPPIMEEAARYEQRFLRNVQNSGDVWDDGLIMNEVAFCMDLWASTRQ